MKGIEKSIYGIISKDSKRPLYITKIDLAKSIGLIDLDKDEKSERLYDGVYYKEWEENLDKALFNLQDKLKFFYREKYIIVYKNGETKEASDDDVVTILMASRLALEKLQIKGADEVILKSKEEEYQRLVTEYISKNTAWEKYYQTLSFIL